MKPLPRTILMVFCLIQITISSEAQLLKSLQDKVKEKAGNALTNGTAEEAIINLAVNSMQKAYAKKDSTSMSMALSSYDNTSFYSDRKASATALRYTSSLLAEINDYDYSQNSNALGINNPFGKNKKGQTSSYDNLTSDELQLLKQAETLNQTGELSYASRYFKYSETSFIGAILKLQGNPNLENSLLNAKVQSNLGMLYHAQGDFVAAEEQFGITKDVLVNVPNSEYQRAVTLNNESILLKDLGRFNESERRLKEAMEILDNSGRKASGAKAIMQNNLAILYQYLGRLDESIQILEGIIQNNEANWNQKSNTFQRININLALIYENAGMTEKAEVIYLNALKLKEKQARTKQPDYASILTNLSSLYLNTNQLDKNIGKALTVAEGIYRKEYGDVHPTVSSVLKIKGLLKIAKGNKSEGLNTLKENLDLVKQIYGENSTRVNESRILVAYAKWLNGDASGAATDFHQALDNNIQYIKEYFPAMSEVEKSKYWQTLQSDFQTYYAFVVDLNKPELTKHLIDYEVIVKGLLLSTSGKIRQQILASNNSKLIKKYEEWKSTKTLVAYYYSLSSEELSTQKINVDSLVRVSNQQEKWLSANSDVFSSSTQQSASFQDISNALQSDEVLVDVIKYFNPAERKDQYAAAVITSSNAQIVKLGDAEVLEDKAIKLYKNAIKFKQTESKSFYSYWNAIEAKMNTKKKIFLVKDGVYNQVSIGSLHDGSQYLAERYNISVLTNPGELLKVNHDAKRISSIFLMGSPAFDLKKYTALPGTEEEIKTIEGLATGKGVKVKSYLDANASEANFENSSEYNVLHVATHGFFVDKKTEKTKLSGQKISSGNALEALLRSGLVLADETSSSSNDLTQSDDGLATAFEIGSLDFPNTEIVVLSACETGLGEIHTGEGVYGLQRSFLVAGANSVIMSLWKVDDSATRDFMIEFYREWLNTGNKFDAFNKAKRATQAKYNDPYYWGAFVMIEG